MKLQSLIALITTLTTVNAQINHRHVQLAENLKRQATAGANLATAPNSLATLSASGFRALSQISSGMSTGTTEPLPSQTATSAPVASAPAIPTCMVIVSPDCFSYSRVSLVTFVASEWPAQDKVPPTGMQFNLLLNADRPVP